MNHWGRFPAWRPLAKQAKKPDFHFKNSAQRENLFMRWKESFLVPDHRVREISGASFEGFYYICFNQVTGNISGIYFHARSEKCVYPPPSFFFFLDNLPFVSSRFNLSLLLNLDICSAPTSFLVLFLSLHHYIRSLHLIIS